MLESRKLTINRIQNKWFDLKWGKVVERRKKIIRIKRLYEKE